MITSNSYTSYHVEDHVCAWLAEHLCKSDWQFVDIDEGDVVSMASTRVGFQFYDPNHAVLFKLACW